MFILLIVFAVNPDYSSVDLFMKEKRKMFWIKLPFFYNLIKNFPL